MHSKSVGKRLSRATRSASSQPANRVLLVDDEPLLRSALADSLRIEGYAVEEFGDGAAALQFLIGGGRADVLVVDLLMPVMSGWEFLISARGSVPSVPVVVMSGGPTQPPPDMRVAAQLQKPFLTTELLEAVRYCFRLSRRTSAQRAARVRRTPATGTRAV